MEVAWNRGKFSQQVVSPKAQVAPEFYISNTS